MTKYDVMYNASLTLTLVLWLAVIASFVTCAILFETRCRIRWILLQLITAIFVLFAAINITSALDDIDHHRDEKNAEVPAGSVRICNKDHIVVIRPLDEHDLEQYCRWRVLFSDNEPP